MRWSSTRWEPWLAPAKPAPRTGRSPVPTAPPAPSAPPSAPRLTLPAWAPMRSPRPSSGWPASIGRRMNRASAPWPRPRRPAFLALRAGASESWGIVVIAGTGTIAVGRDPVGTEFRTVGEGRAFGDFGDEFDVSELAVRAVADHYTGRGPATILTEM